MKNLVLIKLGGSVITDKSKPFTARVDIIQKLGIEIKRKYIKRGTDLIIGHGQGSYAHIPAAKYQTQKGLINKNSVYGFAEVSEMAKRPNTILTQEFLKLKIPIVSFSPMSFVYTNNTKLYKLLVEHIKRSLDLGMIPAIYGDVILDKSSRGFCIYSGETTLDFLAKKLSKFYKKITIIFFTDTNGVYDYEGKTIPKITLKNFNEVKKYITGSKNTDVTGGMLLKVKESLRLVTNLDAEVYIMNGLSRGLPAGRKGKFTKICRS